MTNKLTERERWLVIAAYKAGYELAAIHPEGTEDSAELAEQWLATNISNDLTVEETLVENANRETAERVHKFTDIRVYKNACIFAGVSTYNKEDPKDGDPISKIYLYGSVDDNIGTAKVLHSLFEAREDLINKPYSEWKKLQPAENQE